MYTIPDKIHNIHWCILVVRTYPFYYYTYELWKRVLKLHVACVHKAISKVMWSVHVLVTRKEIYYKKKKNGKL